MNRKKILIIEDEYDLALMVKKYLLREQYEAELVLDGGKALSTYESYQPDMILLDLMLPEMDGLEILRQLRTKSTVPVIITSAKETELDRILGLKIGADDYLVKPFSIKELVARVEAIFRRIGNYTALEMADQTFNYHHFTIDLTSRVIKNAEKIINLTPKEFDVLVFLVQHPKQVLSKAQIYDSVWRNGGYGDINTVTIHVQKIREKLGETHEITTIRGIGYRFDGALI